MAKFKTGERVRRIKHSGTITNCPIGFETTVEEALGCSGGFWYRGKDGSRQNTTSPDDWELVKAGPVRTVTRKEIVPGKYGRVHVDSPFNGFAMVGLSNAPGALSPHLTSLNHSDLRDAARVFTELADALEEVAE